MQTETRTVPFTLETRAATDDSGPVIYGHASVFAPAVSMDLGGFQEQVDHRAFNRTLREGGYGGVIMSFFNHDPSFVLGRSDNQTLTVKRDKVGLAFEVRPPDTQWARDLVTSLARSDIKDASFAMFVRKDEWLERPDGSHLRTILDADLLELGPVTRGAYPSADSQVRALLESRGISLNADAESAPAACALLEALGVSADALAATVQRLRANAPEDGDAEQLRALLATLGELLPTDTPPTPDEWAIAANHRSRTLELLKLR